MMTIRGNGNSESNVSTRYDWRIIDVNGNKLLFRLQRHPLHIISL